MTYFEFYKDNLSSPIFPAVVIFVLSFIIASLFMMVLEVAVDTVFLCFLIDEEVHHTPRFASKKLKEIVSDHKQQYDENDKSAPINV